MSDTSDEEDEEDEDEDIASDDAAEEEDTGDDDDGDDGAEVGLYKSSSVDPRSLKAPGFNPWTYDEEVKKQVSNFVFSNAICTATTRTTTTTMPVCVLRTTKCDTRTAPPTLRRKGGRPPSSNVPPRRALAAALPVPAHRPAGLGRLFPRRRRRLVRLPKFERTARRRCHD
jgi:hypothetical protein